jgi:hypothetical protein
MRFRLLIVVAASLTLASPGAGQASLGARMREFLAAVEAGPARVAPFFTRAVDLTWVHTHHEDSGTRVRLWRFPASEIPRALDARQDGPLWASFDIQPEGQPVGLFRHQMMTREAFAREKGWRRVHGTRFVPAGEGADAGMFVEWRREGGEWVVVAFGDESFAGKLPEWCC